MSDYINNDVQPPDKPMGPLNDQFKWFLANMSFNSTPQSVREFFETLGAVNFVKIVYKGGKSRGYGFLYMMDEKGDSEVEKFANHHYNRIQLDGKTRVLLQRHDEQRAQPARRNKYDAYTSGYGQQQPGGYGGDYQQYAQQPYGDPYSQGAAPPYDPYSQGPPIPQQGYNNGEDQYPPQQQFGGAPPPYQDPGYPPQGPPPAYNNGPPAFHQNYGAPPFQGPYSDGLPSDEYYNNAGYDQQPYPPPQQQPPYDQYGPPQDYGPQQQQPPPPPPYNQEPPNQTGYDPRYSQGSNQGPPPLQYNNQGPYESPSRVVPPQRRNSGGPPPPGRGGGRGGRGRGGGREYNRDRRREKPY